MSDLANAIPPAHTRRILVCVTGMSPQVVTETVYALAVRQTPAFVPTEIHLVSTALGAEQARLELTAEGNDQLGRLCRDYGIDRGGIRFDDSTIHVITDAHGHPVRDLLTPADNNDAADCLVRVLRQFTEDAGSAVHVSIAGGRKTMGFYAGYALSLLGRSQDRLSHVLVSEPFEAERRFFYPTRKSAVIDIKGRAADASTAEVTLAEIPFVRLRRHVDPKLLKSSETGYRALVRGAEKSLDTGSLEIRFLKETTARPPELQIICAGTPVHLPPMHAAVYCYFAERAAMGLPPIAYQDIELRKDVLRQAGRYLARGDTPYKMLRKRIDQCEPIAGQQPAASSAADVTESRRNFLEQAKSKIRRALIEALGTAAAAPYEIHNFGPKGRSAYGLRAPAQTIRIVDDADPETPSD